MDLSKIVDVLVGLCTMGVSALTGFMFAVNRRMAVVETHMEGSITGREESWGTLNSQRGKRDKHRAESIELAVDLKYIKEKLSDISSELKILSAGVKGGK